MSAFDLRKASGLLGEEAGVGPIHVLAVTGSTNDDARRLAAEGAPEGTVVVAEAQRAGRGRHGNPWHSPAGRGLYVSVVFRPAGAAADATRFTLVSAVAAAGLPRMGPRRGDQWPTTAQRAARWRGRQLRTTGTTVVDLVVGTGFNVSQEESEFPQELWGRAASLRMAAGGPVDRERLFASYVTELLQQVRLLREGRWEEVRRAWSLLAPGATGGRVRVVPARGAPSFEAVTARIDPSGALRVRDWGKQHAVAGRARCPWRRMLLAADGNTHPPRPRGVGSAPTAHPRPRHHRGRAGCALPRALRDADLPPAETGDDRVLGGAGLTSSVALAGPCSV